MSTTSIRISDELKERIAAVARDVDKTPHAFMLDALTEATERAEVDVALRRLATERWAALLRTGQSVPWDEARAWVKARVVDRTASRPEARVPVDHDDAH